MDGPHCDFGPIIQEFGPSIAILSHISSWEWELYLKKELRKLANCLLLLWAVEKVKGSTGLKFYNIIVQNFVLWFNIILILLIVAKNQRPVKNVFLFVVKPLHCKKKKKQIQFTLLLLLMCHNILSFFVLS